MIVYGVRRQVDDEFADRCLSSIVKYGGPDTRILTSHKADPGAAAKELVDEAADIIGLDALILLDGAVEILDAGFTHRLQQALTTAPPPSLICLADADADIDDAFVIMTRPVVHRWRLEADSRDGRAGYTQRLRDWVTRCGGTVAWHHFGVTLNRTHTTTMDRLTHVLAAARQGTWIERIGDAMRHQTQHHQAQPHHWQPQDTGFPDTGSPDTGFPQADYPEPGYDDSTFPPANAIAPEPRRLTAYHVPERPELLCHLPADAQSILVAGHQPQAIAEVIQQATSAQTMCLLTPGDPTFDTPDINLGAGDELPFNPGQFDAMILADALSHVRDPRRLLTRLLPHLAPGGRVIASLPNAKHWTHTLPLLLNDHMRYGGSSLLDEQCPIRMFTLVEATVLFDEAGLTTYHFCNGTRYPADDPQQLDTLIEWFALAGANPQDARTMLTCYQYVLVTSRGS